VWQGGGWCNNIQTCVYPKKTRRGSSDFMEKEIPFTEILSNKAKENPGFFSAEKFEMIKFFSFHFLVIFISRFLYVIVPHVRRFFQLE